MMEADDIHTKLYDLGEKLKDAEKRLAMKRRIPDGHEATAAELKERYSVLLEDVSAKPSSVTRLGQNVADLEYALELWTTQLDNEEL
jgi:uncharacterized protein YoxC